MLKYFCVLLTVLTVKSVTCAPPIEQTSVLQLKSGPVQGIVQDVGDNGKIFFYQGIRYGRANRFEKAKPAEPWSDVYDASTFRDGCYQFGSFDLGMDNPLIQTTKSFSEDCLYLNVFRPATEVSYNRSVMVWIHGGAFEIGTIFTSAFDSRHIAHDGDVIVVTVNYRLGPLGFLYGGSAPGNLGLHDQILALKWVQENIHYFGGDASKVTIFGESAGSISVASLILSPLAKGLFHRAIMQSGAPTAQFAAQSKGTLLKKTKIFSRKLDCPIDKIEDTIHCLRNKTIAQLQNATLNDFAQNEFFIPLYGDELMPLQPLKALKTGKFNKVDLMFGVTRDEGTLFAPMVAPKLIKSSKLTIATSKLEIIKMMKFYDVSNGKEVADFYISKLRNPTQDKLKNTVSSVWGDYHLVCPTILFGEEFARASQNSTHIYSFRLMQEVIFPGLPHLNWTGVTHGQDLVYLFMTQLIKQNPDLHQLSVDMIRAWTNFAKTGKPGKIGSVRWRNAFVQNSSSNPSFMHLEASKYRMVDNYYKQICDSFWKPKIFGRKVQNKVSRCSANVEL